MEALAVPRRRSPGRVALIALGAIVTVGLIGLGAFFLLNIAAEHSFQTTAAYSNVRTLVVHSGAGDVTLTGARPGGSLVVTAKEAEGLFKPNIGSRLDGDGTLTLTAGCPGQLECSVHYELAVPPDIAVRVSSGFGAIRAAGLTSASTIQLGTTAGDIHATGLNAPDIRLSTGLGGLTATLTRPARKLNASTGAGSINLTVPDTTYAVHASSGLGHVSDHSVRNDPTSPRSIDAHSSLGDVTIAVGG